MIVIRDNVLNPNDFEELQRFCQKERFVRYPVGNKEYLMLFTPKEIKEFLKIEGHRIILSFIRKAYQNFDKEHRIHADHKINGVKADLASVLYINDDQSVTPNGTAFYKHHKYNYELPHETCDDEFNRLLNDEAEDLSKWQKTDQIKAIPNRILIYPGNRFHSKWPKVIKKGERIVCVTFYQEIK